MATRYMQQYNVTQADLLEQATNENDYAAMGSQSVVAITRAGEDGKRVTDQTWVSDVGSAMNTLFDTKSYSTARATSLEWTFYGIAANTVPAAMAFEMAHNLALEWASSKGKHKHSYLIGIGYGLWKIADKEKERENRRAEAVERQQREQNEGSKIYVPQPGDGNDEGAGGLPKGIKARVSPDPEEDTKSSVMLEGYQDNDTNFKIKPEESDSEDRHDVLSHGDDDDWGDTPNLTDQGYVSDDNEMKVEPTFEEEDEKSIDFNADFEEQLREAMPKPAPDFLMDSDDESDRPNTVGAQLTVNPWNTSQALVRFRQSATKVAEEYLKAQNTKLSAGRKRKRTVQDQESYRQGMEDSKKIDMKRRRIEGANAAEAKCPECRRNLIVGSPAPGYPGLPTRVECQCSDE